MTKDYVCGLEAVLPSGEVITCGGKLVKNVTGYNLVQLLIGSEGTLAVVTKIILRLLPLPKLRVDLLVPFNDFQAAANTVSDIIAQRIVPTTIEFMERDSVLACDRWKEIVPLIKVLQSFERQLVTRVVENVIGSPEEVLLCRLRGVDEQEAFDQDFTTGHFS